MLVIDILDFLNIFFQGVAQITSVVPNDFSCTMCFLFLFFFLLCEEPSRTYDLWKDHFLLFCAS